MQGVVFLIVMENINSFIYIKRKKCSFKQKINNQIFNYTDHN